jgi:5'-3' exonuclease
MGIPSYFKKIVQEHPECIQSTIDNKIDVLSFDLNCAIHPSCRETNNETIMINNLLNKINECICLCNPKRIFIAIDGPAPRMKMIQQRERRIKSANTTKIWDTNAITPGTNFMNKINESLKRYKWTIPCIISDSNEEGEGEHKIMKYIDNTPTNEIHCIYGLDADLMMLSMIRDHRVFLLREKTEYNIERLSTPYIYCDIGCLKESLISLIKKKEYRVTDNNLLFDYLFLCFFVGNDFIINTPSLQIRYGGIDKLYQCYEELQSEYFGYFSLLDDNRHINLPNFKKLLLKLKQKEHTYLKELSFIRDKQSRRIKDKYNQLLTIYLSKKSMDQNDYPCDEETFIDFIDNLPILIREKEKDIIESENYNILYSMYHLYNETNYDPSYKYRLKNDVNTLCNDYLQSILWTTYYYFHNCISWRWYYKYHFAPLLCDLCDYCMKITDIDFNEKDSKPYTPNEQLGIVLPKQSFNLITDKSKLLDEYMYPLDTQVTMFMKRYYWECHLNMPH